MILDRHNQFCDAQELLTTGASTDSIDLGVANRRLGAGEPLFIRVAVAVAFTDAGSDSTMAVVLQQDDNSAFASATAIQTIGTFAALSPAGTELLVAIDPSVITERYLRLYFTVADGDLTTGAFDGHIVHGPDVAHQYPNDAKSSISGN